MENKALSIEAAEVARAVESATLRFQARLMKIDDLAAYLSCSRNYARKLAEYAGAVRRLGSSWLADRLVIDRYLLEHDGELVPPEVVAGWRAGSKNAAGD